MPSRLFRAFILRRLAQEPARTLTTIVGIALGVAVVIAIQLTNGSSVRGFETALATVAGRTSVEVMGPGGVDETLLSDLGWLRQHGAIAPVIEGEMAIVTDEDASEAAGAPGAEATRRRPPSRRSEAVKVLGVDILRDLTLRDYVVAAREREDAAGSPADALTAQQFLELLTSPRSIVITEKLARRRGFALGDEIRLMAGDRINTFVVRALLADEGPARVMDGSFVLMDIAAAQLAFNRLGRIDRLDVQLGDDGHPADSADIDAALEAIKARLPAGLAAQRPGRRGEQVERMLAAFHLNLSALSWVALVVGLFLVYNTVTISVIARREEIGVLRAGRDAPAGARAVPRRGRRARTAGHRPRRGSRAAAGRRRHRAHVLHRVHPYIATAAAPPALGAWHLLLAFAIGVPLSLAAAIVPAREASQVAPTAAIRGADRLESRRRLRPLSFVLPLAVLAGAALLSQLGPIGGRPLFGYAASFVTIIGASLLVPAAIYLLARAVRQPLRRILGVEGLLAHANLASAIPRLSISVAALAVSLSMMVAIAVMIGSFRDTVAYWIGQTLQADLFIGPGVQPTVGSEQTLSEPAMAAVRAHPDVEAVDSFRNVDLVYQGNLVVLGAGNFDIVLSHGSLLFKSPADGRAALRDAIGTDAVVVSEAFANKYGASPGDTLRLQTPLGERPFRVAAVYYDYAVDRGVIVMDRGTFRQYFGDLTPTGMAAYLKPGASPERVRAEILASMDEGHRVFIYTNRDLRAEVLRIFDSTFAITYALEIIAIVVAMLGVAATLLTLVIERRRELSMLRLIGAARRQVQRMVVIEAALIGAASQAIGLIVGLALSVLLVYVINVQSFGWTIQFRVPVVFLLQVSVAVVAATAFAGLYPARRAAQLVVDHDE
ncbi:MAG: ABC transporter permease [Vicinamibacterales bacterium]